MSLLHALHLFPLDFFYGTAGFWFDTHTDPTQHVTGMWAFVQDEWRFPLLHTTLLNAPEGVSAAFTDSIPIAALLFKPIYSLLPPGSHYFGWWVLACYLLQGIAGATATAAIAGRTLAGCIAGTLFAAMMPSLLIRIPHAALLAQWLLLFMLALHVVYQRGSLNSVRFGWQAIGLLVLAALIHPYLLAMLFAVYAGVVAARALSGHSAGAWARGIALLLLPLPLLGFVLYCVGYFSTASGLPPAEVGFDQNSMNVLSPLLGTHLAPARFLPDNGLVLDATGLQIDGHNYLGAGLLAMIAFGLVFHARRALQLLKRQWVMTLLMVGLTGYALSNVIYLSDRVVLTYAVPEALQPLTQIFRASGRFFWPVGYALLLATLGLFLTRPNPSYRLALLLLLVVQYVDLAPHRAYLAEAAHRDPVFAYDRELWDERVSNASAVHLLPAYGCGAPGTDALFLQYFTALHAVPFNSGFVARAGGNCGAKEQVLRQPRQPGELFIFSGEQYAAPGALDAAMMGQADNWCAREAIGLVCQVPHQR